MVGVDAAPFAVASSFALAIHTRTALYPAPRPARPALHPNVQ